MNKILFFSLFIYFSCSEPESKKVPEKYKKIFPEMKEYLVYENEIRRLREIIYQDYFAKIDTNYFNSKNYCVGISNSKILPVPFKDDLGSLVRQHIKLKEELLFTNTAIDIKNKRVQIVLWSYDMENLCGGYKDFATKYIPDTRNDTNALLPLALDVGYVVSIERIPNSEDRIVGIYTDKNFDGIPLYFSVWLRRKK